MDYRNIFESSLNEARETTQLPDDDKFIKIVKERAVNPPLLHLYYHTLHIVRLTLKCNRKIR